MTSILTNGGAIVALQTLKMTNKNLAMTQSQISTGKAINSASDGSAIWAVAKTMETDRDAFKTIQSGLNVAAKVVSTAVENADGIVDDLNKIKTRLSSSSNSDQDAAKNWNEIKELIDGIEAKINGSQINGVNLLNNNGTGNDGKPYKVLASLDRSYGNATTGHSSIEVESVDLKTAILDVLKEWKKPESSGDAKALISGETVPDFTDYGADKTSYDALKTKGNGRTDKEDNDFKQLVSKYTVGDVDGATVLDKTTIAEADFAKEYTTAGSAAVAGAIAPNDYAQYELDHTEYTTVGTGAPRKAALEAQYNVGGITDAATSLFGTKVLSTAYDTKYPGKAAVEATTAGVAPETSIEALISVAIEKTAELGAKQHRIEAQAESVGKIADNLTVGIGAMVDANLEEASARLQALQAQQQLGIQALSIANQAPQSILSLFR